MKIEINERQKQTLISTIKIDIRKLTEEREKHRSSPEGSYSIYHRIGDEILDLKDILKELEN